MTMAAFLSRRLIGNRSSQILGISNSSSGSALNSVARAFFSSTTPIKATLFPGDGIGPEIAESVKQVPYFNLLSSEYTIGTKQKTIPL